jgi:hypothetical protein
MDDISYFIGLFVGIGATWGVILLAKFLSKNKRIEI